MLDTSLGSSSNPVMEKGSRDSSFSGSSSGKGKSYSSGSHTSPAFVKNGSKSMKERNANRESRKLLFTMTCISLRIFRNGTLSGVYGTITKTWLHAITVDHSSFPLFICFLYLLSYQVHLKHSLFPMCSRGYYFLDKLTIRYCNNGGSSASIRLERDSLVISVESGWRRISSTFRVPTRSWRLLRPLFRIDIPSLLENTVTLVSSSWPYRKWPFQTNLRKEHVTEGHLGTCTLVFPLTWVGHGAT